jgi:hypothetical protein
MATLWFVVLNSWQYPPGSQFDAWTVFGVFVAAAGCLVWGYRRRDDPVSGPISIKEA